MAKLSDSNVNSVKSANLKKLSGDLLMVARSSATLKATPRNIIDGNSDQFTQNILNLNVLACCPRNPTDADLEKATQEARLGLKALNSHGALQKMLAAQMLSIHQLQQQASAFANKVTNPESTQYFTNAAIKLANCFTQQAALLAKLQGTGAQKIVVEHVEVHHGGQAVVGNINGGIPTDREKK